MQYDSLGGLTIWGRRLCPDAGRFPPHILSLDFLPHLILAGTRDPGLVFCLTLWGECLMPRVLQNSRDTRTIHIAPLPGDGWRAHLFTVCCSDRSKGLTIGKWGVGVGGKVSYSGYLVLGNSLLGITSCEIQCAFSRAKENVTVFKLLFFVFIFSLPLWSFEIHF